MTALNLGHVNGRATSNGFLFAACDGNFTSVRFNSDIPENRRSAFPELTQGAWVLEFTPQQKDEILKNRILLRMDARQQAAACRRSPVDPGANELVPISTDLRRIWQEFSAIGDR
jgi:hypothetical protein